MTSNPTFVATFADGEITRMTVHHASVTAKLDVKRGVILARHAYRSRMHRDPPTIVEAFFARDGETLASYDAAALAVKEEKHEPAR